MFGLQGAVAYSPHDPKALEFVVFDLSPRIPGDPAIGPTSPEMRNLSLKYKKRIEDPLDLTIMEIQRATSLNRLQEVVT
jgi:5-formaminoimidazole-4-carboxamide-1-(beta)-D-ribofuranosyl 5'-monophosphate synthetase